MTAAGGRLRACNVAGARGRCAPRMRHQEMISLTYGSAGLHRDRPCVAGSWAVGSRVLGWKSDASGLMDDLVMVLERELKLQLCPARLVVYMYYYCYPTLRPRHKRARHVTAARPVAVAARRVAARHTLCCLRPLRSAFLREPCAKYFCNCQTTFSVSESRRHLCLRRYISRLPQRATFRTGSNGCQDECRPCG
jgi:hypothetical protein